MKPGKVLLMLAIPFFAATLGATDISLAGLRLATDGAIPDGSDSPLFVTTGSASLRFIPASWVNFRTGASFYIPDTVAFFNPLPESQETGILKFDNASASFYPSFGDGLCISVFTGAFDDPSSDTLLREFLKTEIDTPEFQDLPAGLVFSPSVEITGTGAALTTVPQNGNTILGFYGYWNSKTDSNAIYNGDLRFCGTGDRVKFNTFAELSSQPAAVTSLTVRGGISALFVSDSGNELYTAAGIRNTDFTSSRLKRNMYLIFEPRIHLQKADLTFSFFSSPEFDPAAPSYVAVDSESNYLGVNVLAAFGNIHIQKMRGGVSFLANINMQPSAAHTPYSFSISPFYSMMVSDYLFEIAAMVNTLSLDNPKSAVALRLSLKAEY